MPVIAELLLQTLPCRVQRFSCHEVSGKRSWRLGSKEGGHVARLRCRKPVCTSVWMPDEILIVATRFGFEACVVRKIDTDNGTSADEKDPGIMRISN